MSAQRLSSFDVLFSVIITEMREDIENCQRPAAYFIVFETNSPYLRLVIKPARSQVSESFFMEQNHSQQGLKLEWSWNSMRIY